MFEKNQLKTIFYSLVAIMLMSSATCRKTQTDTLEKQLIGVWKYTGKSGGYAGKQEKADPAINNTLQFKRGFIYIQTTNDQVLKQGHYELYKTKSIYSGKEDQAIRFGSPSDQMNRNSILFLRGDSLTIADNVYDGFKMEYIRVK